MNRDTAIGLLDRKSLPGCAAAPAPQGCIFAGGTRSSLRCASTNIDAPPRLRGGFGVRHLLIAQPAKARRAAPAPRAGSAAAQASPIVPAVPSDMHPTSTRDQVWSRSSLLTRAFSRDHRFLRRSSASLSDLGSTRILVRSIRYLAAGVQ